MSLKSFKNRTALQWAAGIVMASLCAFLAVVQYRWTGELSGAQRDRLRSALETSLRRIAEEFNGQIGESIQALTVPPSGIGSDAAEVVYGRRFEQFRRAGNSPAWFRGVALAIPSGGKLVLKKLDPASSRYVDAAWPEQWDGLRLRMEQRLAGGPPPNAPEDSTVVEIPRMLPGGPGSGRSPGQGGEQEWLILDFDPRFLAESILPPLIERHLGGAAEGYRVAVFPRSDPAHPIYLSHPRPPATPPDASISIFEPSRGSFRRGGGGPRPPQEPNRGRWILEVRHEDGTLESIVDRTRSRNLAISVGVLLLMAATAAYLVRLSRQAHELAELQMRFVAGVSHELRTPLTVIRTAAFNLRGKIAANPASVERYGELIKNESEKLTDLVEQVLRFSGSRAGKVVGQRLPVPVDRVVESALQSSRIAFSGSRLAIDRDIPSGLPLVMADEMALQHALRNLIDNAVKYGTEGSDWIGIKAHLGGSPQTPMIEIRVEDRGPGIPAGELPHIFEPFFRGRRAVADQIHGSGLGLNLVKQIVEAHGGRVRAESTSMKGTSMIVTIPTAPLEMQNEFVDTAD